jgi:hypothetical protein
MICCGKNHLLRHKNTRRFPPERPPDPESTSPDAVAALGASKSDQPGRQVFAEINYQEQVSQPPLRATLIGSNRCEAEGLSARGYAPVLKLCRNLVAAGFNPARQLEAWRGNTLCLRVRSIGEGARLTIADDRHGTPRLRRLQERPQGYAAGSPVAQIADGRGVTTPATAAGHRGDRAMSKGGIARRTPHPAGAQADDGAGLQSSGSICGDGAVPWPRRRLRHNGWPPTGTDIANVQGSGETLIGATTEIASAPAVGVIDRKTV